MGLSIPEFVAGIKSRLLPANEPSANLNGVRESTPLSWTD
jgi:hypothetical protein